VTLAILFFGKLRDAAACSTMTLETPHDFPTVDSLIGWLAEQNATLGDALATPGARVAVDKQFACRATSLSGAREVAFMAPLSGG
jgi:sulfur-carrier protein